MAVRQVAVVDRNRFSLVLKPSRQVTGDHHRTVTTASATHGDRHIAFPLRLVARQQMAQERFDVLREGVEIGVGGQEFLDCLILAGQCPQAGLVERIVEKAGIEPIAELL